MRHLLAFTLATLPMLFSTRALAGERVQLGIVDFAFDGGTLKCEFGSNSCDSKPKVALIVHPASVKTTLKRKGLVPVAGTTGSTVLIFEPNGKHRLLDRDGAAAWAKERIAEMATRSSSVADNAFVATVLHTLTTGDPVRVWASDGVQLLESGRWSALFDSSPRSPDGFSDSDPFADPDGG